MNVNYAYCFLTLSIIAPAIALFSCAARTQAIEAPNSIASLEKVNIGGIDQWLLIRGHDRSDPVLLFLHGGPGIAEMAMTHDMWPELEKKFVFVHWDQRGAGKSYYRNIPPDTMNIDQFISDTYEVVEFLRTKLGAEKIYLAGHSWGSQLGIMVARKYPQLFYAYVGIGQVVNSERQETISYQFVLDEAVKRKNKLAVYLLKKIGPPPYKGNMGLYVQRHWLDKFGGVALNKEADYLHSSLRALTSKEYSFMDLVRFFRGINFSLKHMQNDIVKFNLFEEVPGLEVPAYFIIGRHDYNTPWILVEEYFNFLDDPKGKKLIWFDNSGHMLPFEEPDKFQEIMINRVLAETH